MQAHHFTIQKTVRYFTIGQIDERRKHLWVCLHGYGQLADWFGKRFEKWASKDRLFLFPEAPHRFYTQGTSGTVGASWMTREDRLSDIADQFAYLESLLDDIRERLSPDCTIHVLGFSQGVATALRWIENTEHPIASLICWAGTFPADIDYRLKATNFKKIKLIGVFGDEDEFISPEKADELLLNMAEQGISIEAVRYHGGHRIYPELLEEYIVKCEEG